MASAGLTLIFGMMGVLNFAHARFYMLGASVCFTLTRTFGFSARGFFGALDVLLTRSGAGRIVRGAPLKPAMVEALGHNLPVVFMGVFAGGAALAGLAGAVAGAFFPPGPNMAVDFGTLVFVVVVVGGLGSLEGALVASRVIGLSISFSVGLSL